MVNAGDPVGDALVSSLARPGGNVTGVAHLFSEVVEKSLELLTDLLPDARIVAALYPRGNATIRRVVATAAPKARALGLRLDAVEVATDGELGEKFAAMRDARTDAVYVVLGGTGISPERAVNLALEFRLPSVHTGRAFVAMGGLMGYWADDTATWRSVGRLVGKVLNGATPRDLPVEQPSRLELVINMKTARALRLTIPPSLLLRADQVIE